MDARKHLWSVIEPLLPLYGNRSFIDLALQSVRSPEGYYFPEDQTRHSDAVYQVTRRILADLTIASVESGASACGTLSVAESSGQQPGGLGSYLYLDILHTLAVSPEFSVGSGMLMVDGLNLNSLYFCPEMNRGCQQATATTADAAAQREKLHDCWLAHCVGYHQYFWQLDRRLYNNRHLSTDARLEKQARRHRVVSLYQYFLTKRYLPYVCTAEYLSRVKNSRYTLRANGIPSRHSFSSPCVVPAEILFAVLPVDTLRQCTNQMPAAQIKSVLDRLLVIDHLARLPGAQVCIAGIKTSTGVDLPVIPAERLVLGGIGELLRTARLISNTPLFLYLLQETLTTGCARKLGPLGSFLLASFFRDLPGLDGH